MGEKDFCDEARIWLRRFGGNLYTLLPYAVDSWTGYKENVVATAADENDGSFQRRYQKLQSLTRQIQSDTNFDTVAVFDPPTPETNMVHVYLKASVGICEKARDNVLQKHGVSVFNRLRETSPCEPAAKLGYGAKFEWTIGNANGSIENDVFITSWGHFTSELQRILEDA